MTKGKTKTVAVKAKIAVLYNTEGDYMAAGEWGKGNKRPTDKMLIEEAKRYVWEPYELPYACIVDIELPVPQPLEGKAVRVKVVKR